MNYQQIIDKYYPAESPLRDIYMRHCRQVADKALEVMLKMHLPLDPAEVEAAAMLHDIGIVATDTPGIGCYGTEPYIRHGIIGASMLREEGVPEIYARVAERHTGAGITNEDIDRQHLPLPYGNYLPETLLERLICYADKFFSKSGDMKEKPLEKVRSSIARFGADSLQRFDTLLPKFT